MPEPHHPTAEQQTRRSMALGHLEDAPPRNAENTCRACRCRSSAARECPHVPGIDSVMRPYDIRLQAWQRIATDLPIDRLGAMMRPAALAELPARGKSILAGGRKGRGVVEVNA